MSYEGYTEYECQHGHRSAADVYEKQPIACKTCGERFTRRRSIDSTNGHHVLKWRAIEYRARFKDYVRRGYSTPRAGRV